VRPYHESIAYTHRFGIRVHSGLSLFNFRFMIKHIACDALIDIYGVEGIIYISYDT
jgi:hypothetical protein